MEYKTLTVREHEKYIILKEHILLKDNRKNNESIRQPNVDYSSLHDVIDDLSHLMVKFNLTYGDVCYCPVVKNYEIFRYEILSDEMNSILYNNGVISLCCGIIHSRYLSISYIPSLLFVLRLIVRIAKYVDYEFTKGTHIQCSN